MKCIDENFCTFIGKSIKELNKTAKTFIPFDSLDMNAFNPMNEVDPDEQYYKLIPNLHNNSAYYDEQSFKEMCSNKRLYSKKFLAIHFNARSAPKNLSSVENYLKCLNFDFTIIGLTETWFDDHNVHLYNIPGYKQECQTNPGWWCIYYGGWECYV